MLVGGVGNKPRNHSTALHPNSFPSTLPPRTWPKDPRKVHPMPRGNPRASTASQLAGSTFGFRVWELLGHVMLQGNKNHQKRQARKETNGNRAQQNVTSKPLQHLMAPASSRRQKNHRTAHKPFLTRQTRKASATGLHEKATDLREP